jgi:hypothetical protein
VERVKREREQQGSAAMPIRAADGWEIKKAMDESAGEGELPPEARKA